jgi:hypothetical protein
VAFIYANRPCPISPFDVEEASDGYLVTWYVGGGGVRVGVQVPRTSGRKTSSTISISTSSGTESVFEKWVVWRRGGVTGGVGGTMVVRCLVTVGTPRT